MEALSRRLVLLGAAAATLIGRSALAQAPALEPASPSPSPFARLRQGGTMTDHLMPTPRHAVGATLLGDAVYVAGGGAVTGGGIQSAVHEAFTLAP